MESTVPDSGPDSVGLCSTPLSHPEGAPSRRLLNAFFTVSASSSKILSSPSLRARDPCEEAPKALALSEWRIPKKVVEGYQINGISSMFEWQAECLRLPGVLSGGNLVYSAPTSAGKTLVGELLALKCVLESRKKVIFVLPFISIAQEKCSYLRSLFEPAGVRVGSFAGGQSPAGGLAAVDVAICTIEKANSLVNRLLEGEGEGSGSRLACLGLLVVDELQMIGDPQRGYLLELLITKVLYVCGRGRGKGEGGAKATPTSIPPPPLTPPPGGQCHHKSEEGLGGGTTVQVVGMSAVLPNLDLLGRWLGAQQYHTDFRPVPLTEMVKIGPTLYNAVGLQKIRDLDRTRSLPGDEDDVLLLCGETVSQGHSVLVFCPTKSWCERLAQAIVRVFPLLLQGTFKVQGCRHGDMETATLLDGPGLADICEQLRRTQVGLDPVLGETLPHGVAFHHAGLTMEERDIVETAFRQSLVKVLVATSTLSSGVNLPARRVVVRTPLFHGCPLDLQAYRQMVGRAGRKGMDSCGESILVCRLSEHSVATSLLQSTPRPIRSCLGRRKVGDPKGSSSLRDGADGLLSVKRAVLEVIASGLAPTMGDIQCYMSCTLLFAELKEAGPQDLTGGTGTGPQDPTGDTGKLVLLAVKYLEENEFICKRDKIAALGHNQGTTSGVQFEYFATQLGMATVASTLSPDEALVVFTELCKASKSFILDCELHLVYLVTPVYIQDQWPTIDWYRYLCILERLPADMRRVADAVGVQESFLGRAVQGRVSAYTDAQKTLLWVHQRFYVALALHDLVHEAPMVEVVARYGASRGLLQALQGAAGTFAGMVTTFCSRLGWKNLELLLSQFQSRLTFGVERELCDLVKLPLVNAFWARALYSDGFHTLSSLATASFISVEQCLRRATPFRRQNHHAEEGREVGRGGPEGSMFAWSGNLRRRVTHSEAARVIVEGARTILSEEFSVPVALWSHQQPLLLPQQQATAISAGKLQKGKGLGQLGLPPPPLPGTHPASLCRRGNATGLGPMLPCKRTSSGMVRGNHTFSCSAEVSSGLHVTERCEMVSMNDLPALVTDQPFAKVVPVSNLNDTSVHTSPFFPHSPKVAMSSTPLPAPSSHMPVSPCPLAASFDPATSYAAISAIPATSYAAISADPATSCVAKFAAPVAFVNQCNSAVTSQCNSAVTSPVPLSHSLDTSLNLSTGALAILDAACKEEVSDTASPLQLSTSLPITSPLPLSTSLPITNPLSLGTSLPITSPLPLSTSLPITNPLPLGTSLPITSPLPLSTSLPITNPLPLGTSLPIINPLPLTNSIHKMQEPLRVISESPLGLPTPNKDTTSSPCNGGPAVHFARESDLVFPRKEASVSMEEGHKSHFDYSLNQLSLQDLSALSSSHTSISGITVIDVSTNRLLFETFVEECMEQEEVSFAMATTSLQQAGGIGAALAGTGEKAARGISLEKSSDQVVGVAFCWGGTDAYYLPLTLDEAEGTSSPFPVIVPFSTRVAAITDIFSSAKYRKRFIGYHVKRHLKVLALSCHIFPRGDIADPKVASWLLEPDAREKTIHKMALQYLPNQPIVAAEEGQEGDGEGGRPLSSVATHSSDPQMRAAAESVLSFLLMASIGPLLEREGLAKAFVEVEMPLVPVLVKMELNGIGFSPELCTSLKSMLQDRLAELEQEAYSLAGRSFSLASPDDVARVLFLELKLQPLCSEQKRQRTKLSVVGARRMRRKIPHLSTAKGVLEKLAALHPLPRVILVWRRISTTVAKVVAPLLRTAMSHGSTSHCFRIHATCQMHTATGRVAVLDPPLQSMPKEYDIGTGADTAVLAGPLSVVREGGNEEDCLVLERQLCWYREALQDNRVPKSISMRSSFVPFPGAMFLAADYSQLELRVLAHLSGDKQLAEFLNSSGDAFRMIAGQWLGIPAAEVSSTQRQHAKQVCYGMIYGIGAKALGSQLGISEEEALRFMDSFKSKYPAVKDFIVQTVQTCKESGHITTLIGRKRFLPSIHSPNIVLRSQAERQAVNSRIQGSAADLVKMAMINIDKCLTELFGFAGSLLCTGRTTCQYGPQSGAYVVLQMHDELLYEVPSSILDDVAKVVRHEMENAMNLSVRFPVVIKTGNSWGSLKDYKI